MLAVPGLGYQIKVLFLYQRNGVGKGWWALWDAAEESGGLWRDESSLPIFV